MPISTQNLLTLSPQTGSLGLVSPVQQGMVQVLTEPLQDPVVVANGRSLIFTRSKVALQLSAQ